MPTSSAVALTVALGVNVHLPPTDTFELAGELGTGWVRIDFNWDIAEPSQGAVDWSVFDRAIDDANARGLSVFATIGYGPAWASVSGDRDGTGPKNDVPDAAQYGRFVRDAASRYGTRVAAWGTWNEPNLEEFFEGTRQEWIDNAFIPAVDAVREACPSCLIVGPELATIGDRYEEYLRAALEARGSELSAISWHIYADFPEDDLGAGTSKDSFYNKLDAHRVLEVNDAAVYEGPLSVREVQREMGLTGLPVWITETGYAAAPGDTAGLAEQARYLGRVIDAMMCRPWWERSFFYELTEEHPNGMWPDVHWGIALRTADPDGSYADNFDRKPAFDALAGRIASCGSSCTIDCPEPDAGSGAGGAAGAAASPNGGGSGGTSASSNSDEGGCSCRAVPARAGSWTMVLAALAWLGLRRRRGL